MSNVRDFGAQGDGQHDDTAAVRHTLADGDGTLQFPPGNYRITRPIVVDLAKLGRFSVEGSGGAAKLLMSAAGPCFHLLGSHGKTADPEGFDPAIWSGQRMPVATNIEIEGQHAEADGFWVEGTMQSSFQGVLLRTLRHGIRVTRRARNVLISHCHIYNNRGVGVFFDGLNLHQAIIVGSHISYCKRGGIKIIDSEIRNLHITGNDIEYNYDLEADASADVWIESTVKGSSVREATIASNTIQAKASPGGANIRLVGLNAEENHKVGMFAISGNLIGSQETNVHLVACRGVALSGNFIYSATKRNVLVEHSRHIVQSGNSLEHNPDYRDKQLCVGVRLVDSRDCTISGGIVQDCDCGQPTVADAPPMPKTGLLEIVRCQRVNVNGCQWLDATPAAIDVEASSFVSVQSCSLLETRSEQLMEAAVRFRGPGRGNLVANNTLSAGTKGDLLAEPAAGVTSAGNLIVPAT